MSTSPCYSPVVPRPIDLLHLDAAMQRFRDFFNELNVVFLEREEVLKQSAFALLSREHQLISGPPGTAKSQLAAQVLGRIIDEDTGHPSLFARQFTESTVQTDLVGAINFKTLMDTGRTEHFTDEGLLGSVHAFLDEVFDGRDVLLRSTLNLLHEREFKQGSVTSKGQIECAFMTSNRYISEILETSRQSLLAFVDRLSFISFVPRNFSNPEALKSMVRRHGGGFGMHRPTAPLSLQDVDALQAATDVTYVSEAICDAIAELITDLDREMLEARRHDPKFQPTRFLSARTAVQAATVLRAAVVYDKIFHSPNRALQVEYRDLDQLRYHLLLCGVSQDGMAGRLDAEHDPRERRQLNIIRTEAEIFDRCIARLPKRDAQPMQQKTLAFDSLRTMVQTARESRDPQALVNTVRKLVSAMESGANNADMAASLLLDTVGGMSERALRAGLSPAFDMGTSLEDLAQETRQVASELEEASASNRPISNWLRGRLLLVLDNALALGPSTSEESIALLIRNSTDEEVIHGISARTREFEDMLVLRQELRSAGVSSDASDDTAWMSALTKLEQELVLLWEARFRHAALSILKSSANEPLHKVLDSLTPFLTEIDAAEKRCDALGRKSQLKSRVVSPRLKPLVERALRLLPMDDRSAVITEIRNIFERLSSPEISDVISSEHLVNWLAPLLLRQGTETLDSKAKITNLDSYQTALSSEHKLSVVATLVEVSILGLKKHVDDASNVSQMSAGIQSILQSLPSSLQSQVIDNDLARIERRLNYLKNWWSALTPTTEVSDNSAVEILETVVGSGLLRVLRGDGEPLRLSLEARRIEELFPDSAGRVRATRSAIEAFDTETRQALVELLEGQADRAWQSALED